MRFCKNCDNMLYIVNYVSSVIPPEVGEGSNQELLANPEQEGLSYKCNNCNYVEKEDQTRKCIYENDYRKTNNSSDITNNKYIRYDPTLPRINTVKCINRSCVSNMREIESAIILGDFDIHEDRDDILTKIKGILSEGLNIHDLDGTDILISGSVESLENIYHQIREVHPHCSFKKRLEPQVIFVKYDQSELKYVYICDYCNTSWKNN